VAENAERLTARCCIAGGGPAGVMAGFLLARRGVDVLVLEKHRDFLRDFRGDTIHPSTLELLLELGLLDEFLRQPHQELREIRAYFGDKVIHIADFSHVPSHCKFVAFMPQWDFLNFITSHARRFPTFRLRLESEVIDLIFEKQRVAGLKIKTPQGDSEVRADLIVGADGRSSIVRERAGLKVVDLGAPIDVLWFRISRKPDDPPQAFGFVNAGQFVVLIDRSEYWQCAHVIRKGSFSEKRAKGLPAFREEIRRCVPFLGGRTDELADWSDVKLLSVKVDHLRRWYRDGLLCIGDAAHAMSPVGGVGINLAIQDAVALANLIGPKLRHGRVDASDLKAVQHRREWPTRMMQRVQVFLHEHVLEHVFDSSEPIQPPLAMRLLERVPPLRRIPARMIGAGFRPEHISREETWRLFRLSRTVTKIRS
jgi:2-polyprenyl-6-methoxyphenol hydroxylase-like FAD-dependent oxidoreductase